ncbi:MAG TPA: hypothetical protein VN258_10325 [Mobilitalea sp.]|nr:hypothetical protein [Mobilitalea sp.]
MSDKSRGYTKIDIVREIIWNVILTVVFFVYWVLMLLAITFVFNSIIELSFRAIILISIFLTISTQLYRGINALIKYTRK